LPLLWRLEELKNKRLYSTVPRLFVSLVSVVAALEVIKLEAWKGSSSLRWFVSRSLNAAGNSSQL
jgi:hypothetical protein